MEARPSRIPLLQENPRPRHRHRDPWLWPSGTARA